MDLFNLLRQYARTQGEKLAISSPRRSMSYRKLWSRIERATARLQQEWDIAAGDAVVYYGQGHPDAIVLYVALARSGARLLALEQADVRSHLAMLAQELRLQTIVHDDEIAVCSVLVARPLSSLIMDRCPVQPHTITEDASHPSLLRLHITQSGTLISSSHSLEQLSSAAIRSDPPRTVRSIFDEAVFAPVVLATLMAGDTLTLEEA